MTKFNIYRFWKVENLDHTQYAPGAMADCKQHVRGLVNDNSLEGLESGETTFSWQQACGDGSAMLEDRYNHAIEFAMVHLDDEGRAFEEHLAAGRPITYCDDLYPDAMIRRWPGGRRELIVIASLV